jgi:hypothetical protein
MGPDHAKTSGSVEIMDTTCPVESVVDSLTPETNATPPVDAHSSECKMTSATAEKMTQTNEENVLWTTPLVAPVYSLFDIVSCIREMGSFVKKNEAVFAVYVQMDTHMTALAKCASKVLGTSSEAIIAVFDLPEEQ